MYTIIILDSTPTTYGHYNGSRLQGKYIRLYHSLRMNFIKPIGSHMYTVTQ